MPERRRQARNIHHLFLMTALVIIAIEQLVYGPKGSLVVLAMSSDAQWSFAWLLLISAMSVLVSTVTRDVPKIRWLPPAAFLELGGQFGVAVALGVYTFTLQDTVPFWNTSLGIGFGFVGVASALRTVVLVRYIRRNFVILK